MREYGVPIERVVCCGGIAEKNDLFMQIYADVIGHPMLIAGSPQTPALGAAIVGRGGGGAAATPSFEAAQEKMTALKEKRFTPNATAKRVYDELYGIYRELHDTFGGVREARADLATLMKRLLAIRERETTRGEARSVSRGAEALREEVYRANLELARSGLVIGTFGNVSGIDRAARAHGHQAERRAVRRR